MSPEALEGRSKMPLRGVLAFRSGSLIVRRTGCPNESSVKHTLDNVSSCCHVLVTHL